MLAPRREQLTGDEAHERVLALLDETVDMDLWQAQRVLQAASTDAVDLSGCDALSRALDVAAGEAAALSGAEPLLIDRIDAEYLRYYTPTGRPTGEWAAAIKRLRDADDEVARCAAAVAEVDDAVRRHAALTDNLSRLAEERADAAKRLTEARAAAEAVAALTQQLKQAEVVAAAADATHSASVAALTERRRLRADIDERTAAIAELEAAAARSPRRAHHRHRSAGGGRGRGRRSARRGRGQSGPRRRRPPRGRAGVRPRRGQPARDPPRQARRRAASSSTAWTASSRASR